MDMSFKEFLKLFEQDLAPEIAGIQSQLLAIDQQLAQKTKPLLDQKARLQKLLAIKQQQASRVAKTTQAQQPQQQQQQQTPPGQAPKPMMAQQPPAGM